MKCPSLKAANTNHSHEHKVLNLLLNCHCKRVIPCSVYPIQKIYIFLCQNDLYSYPILKKSSPWTKDEASLPRRQQSLQKNPKHSSNFGTESGQTQLQTSTKPDPVPNRQHNAAYLDLLLLLCLAALHPETSAETTDSREQSLETMWTHRKGVSPRRETIWRKKMDDWREEKSVISISQMQTWGTGKLQLLQSGSTQRLIVSQVSAQ